jgi:PAS domain S-box-containing protein
LLLDAPPSAVPGIAALRDVARNSLAPSLVLEAGPAFRVAHANPACCEAACLAEGAMLGRPLREALPGLHAALPPGALEALAGGARRHLRAWLPAAPLRAGAAAAPVGPDRPPGAGAAQAAPAAPQGDGGLWMLEAAPLHGEGPEGAVAGLFLQLHPAAAGAEEASTRATLDALFEHIPEGLVLADAPDARIRRVSAHALRLVGRAAAEVLDRAAADHPQDWQVLHLDGVTPAAPEALPLTRAVRHGETVQQESWMLRRADGALLTILCSAGPIRGAGDGRIAGGILAFRDVSEMRRTETRLVRSEARYRALVEAGALAVWTAGPDGAMRGAAAWCALTGQAPAEAAGEGWLEAVLAEDRDAVRLCWGEALLAGTVFEAECRVRTARDEAGSGGWCWVLLRAVPVVRGSAAVEAPLGAAPGGGPARAAEGGGGAIAEWIGAATDIHARRMAEEAMRASQERFRTLAEAMPHLVWQTDADGTPDYMNRRMQEFTGLRPGAGAARGAARPGLAGDGAPRGRGGARRGLGRGPGRGRGVRAGRAAARRRGGGRGAQRLALVPRARRAGARRPDRAGAALGRHLHRRRGPPPRRGGAPGGAGGPGGADAHRGAPHQEQPAAGGGAAAAEGLAHGARAGGAGRADRRGGAGCRRWRRRTAPCRRARTCAACAWPTSWRSWPRAPACCTPARTCARRPTRR